MPQNALFYGIYGDSWKSHIIRQAKCRVLAVLLGGVCCYGATCTFGSKRVDTLCWRNAAWCHSHVAPTGENHLGRNQDPEQIAWNENHLFHETGLVRNLWGSTDYNWSKFKTCVMIHRPFKLFKMVFEVIQSKSHWPYNLSTLLDRQGMRCLPEWL